MNYQVINPYTGQRVAEYPQTTDAQLEVALHVGDDYYHSHYSEPLEVRRQQLQNIANTFAGHTVELAQTATTNMGKLYREGLGEAKAAAKIAQYYVNHGATALQNKPYTYQNGKQALLEYDATGIVLAIEPWNFPYTQVMRVFAPNFLLGNPVILKHAAIVAGCASLFEKLVWSAGVENGAFQNLFLSNDQVATAIADPRIQGVALTGSPKAGRTVGAEAAASLTKSTLELGGNDAFVVLNSANVDQAVKDGATSRLRNAGQVCTSAKRFIVQAAVAETFIRKMTRVFESQVMGDPMADTTTIAPLSSKTAQLRLQTQVKIALENGAKELVAGGVDSDVLGNAFRPTLLTNLTVDNPMYDVEFFGPVGQIEVVNSTEEAITRANQSQYGLAGSVYAGSTDEAFAVAQRLETGQIFINQPSNGYPELPFGGVKNSGYGREMSDLALYEFANEKMIAKGTKN
ncbi:aldehyde dehydrogenase family protein [Secundilactobacillus folii]|uniref:Aldehyde dehydrogenase family protein n=1 Tax=Secundilactobacillus folii TaxID=2678357 RepID=A0A7X2XTE2_9LACO|nr:aldehyde dehydrogenase family protein [Secundilactobacillus folii]MTV81228.1 aldehyde dehydrogenase family protein [Secundilactobacillus folii]